MSTIGLLRVFSLSLRSGQIPTGFPVPDSTWGLIPGRLSPFDYRTLTFSGTPFQVFRLGKSFVTSREVCGPLRTSPTTLTEQRPQALTLCKFRLLPFRSPLLRESPLYHKDIGFIRFLFLQVLRCFTSLGLLPKPHRVQSSPILLGEGFPIREPRDQRLLAPPPSVSPLATPFIACRSQAIHHKLLVS